MKITYAHHSGFLVELSDCCLIFDYFEKGLTHLPDKPVLVFASHAHHDHYDPAVFALVRPELAIVSKDIPPRRRPEGVERMKALAPDVCVTAAFGQILTQELLDIPVHGTVNVHASLLPKHRGSAPINWCILMGETVTGVTIMRTDAGIDTGDMLRSAQTPIGELETAGELTARLSELGAKLLGETLPDYLEGRLAPVPQDHGSASYQPMLDKAMGAIDWTQPAREIACRVRGLNPWPCAYTDFDGGRLKVYLAKAVAADADAPAGTVIASGPKEGLVVKCGEGALEILEMQAPGGKRMAAKAYLMGKKIGIGTVLGSRQ